MEIKILGFKARVEVIVISAIIGCLLCCHWVCGCATREGMQSAGAAIDYAMSKGVHNDKYDAKVGLAETNVLPPGGDQKLAPVVPLPEGQLFMWANNEFSGKCCANSNVSGGNGCACITKEQSCYLNARGGNRAVGSEF
tara:strand:- start:285 stop:701 length:417 start_codon:yes stop_codon:yes gene_type:complete